MSGSRGERDHYATLGAGREEAHEEIERRYKRLARLHHPDRGGDEEQMKAVNEAWRVLGDADARREYDARHPQRERTPYVSHRPVSSPATASKATVAPSRVHNSFRRSSKSSDSLLST